MLNIDELRISRTVEVGPTGNPVEVFHFHCEPAAGPVEVVEFVATSMGAFARKQTTQAPIPKPKQCTGDCRFGGVFYTSCLACGWQDDESIGRLS